MAEFKGLQTSIEKDAIRVRFNSGSEAGSVAGTRIIGWQIFDPFTGAFLYEGQAAESTSPAIDLLIVMPDEEGPYRVQVAPITDRSRYVAIDVVVTGGVLEVGSPQVTSLVSQRWQSAVRAIPAAFDDPIKSLWKNRKLIRSMVQRDVLARYRGSFGGALWTFLTPLLLMATYAFVFGFVLGARFPGDPSASGYVLYFLAGMLPWLAFSEAVGRAPTIILEYRGFVNKLVFPLDILPANLVLAGLVTEIIGLVILLFGLLVVRHSVPESFLWLPVLLIPQMLLAVGLAWLLSATGVFVRDLGQLIGFFLTLWFFLTPIGYEESRFNSLPAPAAHLMAMNPILILVKGYRAILLENRAPWTTGANGVSGAPGLIALWIVAILIAALGYGWFQRLRKNFADVI